MDLRGGVKMIEAINEYYIDNGKLRKLEEWREEGKGKLIYEVIRIIKITHDPSFFCFILHNHT